MAGGSDSDNRDSRQRIVDAAEDLFASRGYDGTTVSDIAQAARVNKALIYYYFNSKGDILESLFAELIKDVRRLVDESLAVDDQEALATVDYTALVREMFDLVFGFMLAKRKLIRILLVESLKASDGADSHLFRIADMLVVPEVEHVTELFEQAGAEITVDRQFTLVDEFFTGFMPMVTCAAYFDDWLEHYGFTEEQLKEKFFEALTASHMGHHLRRLERLKE